MRGDAPDRLTAAGREALREHGIRTIIDLRNDAERASATPPADELAVVHIPLDGVEHSDFWETWGTGPQFATPLYYRPHLERFPERTARAIGAIAKAPPGGVLVHCVGGRDRTGQITMVVLALLGVAPETIAADYEASVDRLRARAARLGEADPNLEVEAYLARKGTSAGAVIVSTLASLDVEALMLGGGLGADELAALEARLL